MLANRRRALAAVAAAALGLLVAVPVGRAIGTGTNTRLTITATAPGGMTLADVTASGAGPIKVTAVLSGATLLAPGKEYTVLGNGTTMPTIKFATAPTMGTAVRVHATAARPVATATLSWRQTVVVSE